MKYYRFYDTDIYGKNSYDIKGDEYKNLLEKCFKYSTALILKFKGKNISLYEELDKHKIKSLNLGDTEEIAHYRTCPELLDLMLKSSDSIFEWINGWDNKNPEDPLFLRADGTIFFYSSIHNGELTLLPRQNEDVGSITKNPLWKVVDNIFEEKDENFYGIVHYKEELGKYDILDTDYLKEKSNRYISDMVLSGKIISGILFDVRIDKTNEICEIQYHCKMSDSDYLIVNVIFQKHVCKVIYFST